MANPLRAALGYLRGDDLKVKLPAPEPDPPPAERKLFSFTTDSYDAVAQWVGPVVSAAFGGRGLEWNSAAYACINTICLSFQEAPLRVLRLQSDDAEEWDNRHPFMALLDDPHPSLSQPEVNYWVEFAKQVHGNAYLRKIRSASGAVVQLWPYSPLRVTPRTTEADRRRGVFLTEYRVDLGDGRIEDVPPEDMLHFRMGVDDRDHRLGLSPLRHLMREISSDEEATKFSDSLLRNYAVPGLAVQLPPGPILTEEQAQQIRDRLRDQYGGDGRGQIAVVANGATLQPIGFNPQQMDLKTAHEFPESRIAAVFGAPAMVVGLGIGLARSTFSNYREAREALFEQTIVPLWRADAATYQKQLLRADFDTDPSVRLKYDLNDVRALQEDQNAVYTRLTEAVKAKWLKRNEARSEVGFDPVDGWDEEDEQSAVEAAGALFEATSPPQLESGDEDEEEAPRRREQRARLAAALKARGLPAIPGMLDTMLNLTLPMLEQDLGRYHDRQRRTVVERLRRGDA